MHKGITTRIINFFNCKVPYNLLPIRSGQKIVIPSGTIYGQTSHTVWYGYKTAKRTYKVEVECINNSGGSPVVVWKAQGGKYNSVDINKLPWWNYEK